MEKYIDLHCHLDGSVTVDIAKKLAALQGIDLPCDAELEKALVCPPDTKDLTEFLQCFVLPGSLMQTPEGIAKAVYLVSENIKSHGVVYAEIRFAPQLHCEKGMSQEDAILGALEGVKKTDLHVNLILCAMRGTDTKEANLVTYDLAKKYLVADGGVVAVDLAGAEALYKTGDYAYLFEKAKELGLPYTIHAGEADGMESVETALSYGTKRIGHGVRAMEDPALVQKLIDLGVTLEMCPTSNRQTHAIPDMKDYPLVDFLRKGVKVTINTDDMGIEGTDIRKEFAYVMKEYGLTEDEATQVYLNAVDAAFTTEEVKEKLRKLLKN